MVDLGIDSRERPAFKPKPTPPAGTAPDALVDALFILTYYVSGMGLLILSMLAIHAAATESNYQLLGIEFLVIIACLPTLAMMETMRIGLRMLCIIAQKKD